jgi:DNA-binding MarR family transcriptional regulator
MDDRNGQETLISTCEFDPRYRNLVNAFRQALQRDTVDPVQAYLLILHIARRLLAEEQALFDRYHLSEGKLSVLLLLRNAPEQPLAPSEIAEATRVSRGTMTGLLAGLERDGLVVRANDPQDGRRCAILLAPHTAAVIDQLLLERYALIERLLACFSPAELEQQRAFLEKLNRQMTAAPAVE